MLTCDITRPQWVNSLWHTAALCIDKCIQHIRQRVKAVGGWFMINNTPSTHWGRVTHICVGKLTIIGSVNGLSPGRRQAIIWTNAGILLIGPLGTNFSEILIEIDTISFKKMHLKMSAKWRPFCLSLNVLNNDLGEHFTNVFHSQFRYGMKFLLL